MMFKTFTVGNKELKLRLSSRACVQLEKNLGCSPLQVLMEMGNNKDNIKMPKLTTLIQILHASLQQLNAGYDLNKTYDLYDEYVDNGGSLMDLLPEIIEVFKVSGFFKEDVQVENNENEVIDMEKKNK